VRSPTLPVEVPRTPVTSKRLLALASDERLVAQIRRGSDVAFDVAFERYGPGILAFCRHMLGSREEAEDAVQHVFASAYRDLLRDDRRIRLKPWLYTIARNRCLSMLRMHRDELGRDLEAPTLGLAEQVERQVELRELLRDLRDLPEEQRAALLLSEVGDLSHAEVAGVLRCGVQKVKALVYRARSGLIKRRDARETPCAEIREQLASLRGGSLKRSGLRHHVRQCPGCQEFQALVKHQRGMLKAVLPVMQGLTLKSSLPAGVAAPGALSGTTLATVAIVGVIAGGGAAVEVGIAGGSSETPARSDAAVRAPAPEWARARPAVARVGAQGAPSARSAEPGSPGGPAVARTGGRIAERTRSRESLEVEAPAARQTQHARSSAPEAGAQQGNGVEAAEPDHRDGGPPEKEPKVEKQPKAPKAPKADKQSTAPKDPQPKKAAEPKGPKHKAGNAPVAEAPAADAPVVAAPVTTDAQPPDGPGNRDATRKGKKAK
jgi:RNA polymerase sigma factor (sigma-70 family)